MHELYGFALASLSFAIVFGAFAGNILHGAMQAVPKSQIETASAYGMNSRLVFQDYFRKCGFTHCRAYRICGRFDQSNAVIILAWR